METATKTPSLLATPVQYLRGCGPERAALLVKLGVRTLGDLLFFFPRTYQDLTNVGSVDQFEDDVPISALAKVTEVDGKQMGYGRTLTGVLFESEGRPFRGVWFNQPYMRERFKPGQLVLVSGKPKMNGMRWEMTHPITKDIDPDEPAPGGRLLPVYPLTEGLAQAPLRRLVEQALELVNGQLEEVFPEEYLARHDLMPLATALPQLHFPRTHNELDAARRRFVYQELLVMQLALALRRQSSTLGVLAKPLEATAKIDARIRRLFPFTFTPGQDKAIAEIAADLARPTPMNRLLQGDVGSGKTAVAVYAMLLAVAHGGQGALMAPTEILARQHYQTLTKLLDGSAVTVGLLVGGMREKEREALLAHVAAGDVQLVVGTQAFVHTEVPFKELAVVVIDEQHKFGVRQRAALKRAAAMPHYLVMTATPIPRSVGMTVYGDLDLTTLTDLPPNRQPVRTYVPQDTDVPKWWEFVRRKLREGRQAFVVAPLVEASEKIATASIEETFEALANGELEAFRLALLHGRMDSDEKDRIMAQFRAGEFDVLCATSVIEVGVDIPNASIMTILGAERFGLAQLHQLRGRVGRGQHAGSCAVLTNSESPEAAERLQAFASTTDGFKLAELDFEDRGPGDLFGEKQHGLPPLFIADLLRDKDLLTEARRDAFTLANADPGLVSPEHKKLRRKVLVRYGQSLDLGDVG